MRCYLKAYQNFLNHNGRAGRKELWWLFAFHYIVVFLLSVVDGYFGLYLPEMPYGALTFVYLVLSLPPAVCVQIRRLHDVNVSGRWWIGFHVPLVSLYVLYLYLKCGSQEVNDYGPPIERKASSKRVKAKHPKQELDSSLEKSNKPEIDNSELMMCNQRVLYCRRCGYKLIDGSSFCSKCGTEVIEV